MNIFIAGLNYNMSEAELGELFAEYGTFKWFLVHLCNKTDQFGFAYYFCSFYCSPAL